MTCIHKIIEKQLEDLVPPFPALLLSNDQANESEIAEIVSAINAAEELLPLMDAEIARLQELMLQRESVEEFAAWHKTILAPMRYAPDDILAEIFSHCVEGDRSRYPRLLTLVCRRWRDVVLSNPCLWNQMVIHRYLDHSHPRLPSLEIYVSLHLQRSGGLPLSIIFTRPAPSIMHLLLHYSDRWQDVHLLLDHDGVPLLSSFTGDFPSLTKLRVLVPHVPGDVPAFIATFPRLEELEFTGRQLLRWRFPWSQFRRCVLQDCILTDVLSCLRTATSVTKISVNNCRSIRLGTSITTYVLPSLESLKILHSSPTAVLLDTLTAPALQRLAISDAENPSAPHISTFLMRSTCPLAYLILRQFRVPELELLAILRHTPRLLQLSAEEICDFTDAFMERMVCVPGHDVLVPDLAILSITGVLRTPSDYSLVNMLKSRREALRSADLDIRASRDPDEILTSEMQMYLHCLYFSLQKNRLP
ncbi:hypothetical protein C8R43DRAFT_662091 [Mycena crocata]|nr:hypothetical protein C8R43DRAFT_662091 [Mycena crocata]